MCAGLKGRQENVHPLLGNELREFRELKRNAASPFIFASERGGPFRTSGFAELLERAGEAAKIGFKVHPQPQSGMQSPLTTAHYRHYYHRHHLCVPKIRFG